MIPKTPCALLVLALTIGCAAPAPEAETPVPEAQASAPEAQQSEFVDLFNGENLDGWVIESNGQFSVRDGLLFINRGTGWLRSEKEYADFVLRMRWRFLEEDANSGIFIRTAATKEDDETGYPNNGYQIQCRDTLTGDHPLAMMIPYGAPPYQDSIDLEALARAYRPTGEWHEYEITCVGEELTVKLNGEVVTTATDIKRPTGHVGIQGENGLLEFQTIRIRVL